MLQLIDDDATFEVDARIEDGSVRLDPASLKRTLGWELKPEGLCRGDVCVPVRNPSGPVGDDGIDLAAFADLTGRPLALDADEGAAVLGTAAAQRAAQLASLEAPDFTLPDLDGRLHTLSELRGKKILLAAWASW